MYYNIKSKCTHARCTSCDQATPGYTILQELITNALTAERDRLDRLVEAAWTNATREVLQQLLVRENTLSDLAALKQDAKSFRYRQMGLERQKRLTLAPLYAIAKALLPSLDLSQLNIAYYASLANFYTIYDLRRFKPSQTYLYLLCYAWLATLSTANRQRGGSVWLPYVSTGRRDQGSRQ